MEENDLDSTCGISDDEMTNLFTQAVKIEIEISKIKGTPITRYDAEKKAVFLEYPDGHIEYVEEA